LISRLSLSPSILNSVTLRKLYLFPPEDTKEDNSRSSFQNAVLSSEHYSMNKDQKPRNPERNIPEAGPIILFHAIYHSLCTISHFRRNR